MTHPAPKKAAVIGWPLAHTKSPLIHGHWLHKYGIAGTYGAVPIPPEELAAGIQKLVHEGYAGFNVTVPHKQAVMQYVATLSPEAARIGAVNTVVIGADGRLEGRNTDAFGFIENLKANAPGFDFAKGPAIVLGAGGAARAVVYALGQAGVPDIRIFNRTLARAEELAAAFPNAHAHSWDTLPAHMPAANLVVNTTSLGMQGQPALDVSLEGLPAWALVHDIVYAPLVTGLLAQAHARGHATVTGIGMLLHQARPAFGAWFGTIPDVDGALERLVLA